MELRILSPQEDGFVKAIEWNNEEIKKEVAECVEHYKGLVYTDEQISDAKKDRAKLRKFVDALEAKRKEVKKQCIAPYEQFERQVKEIITIVNEPINLIDAQIKEVEEQRRIEKKANVLAIYEEHIGSLKGILPFKKVFKNEYLNVSKSMKSITEEIQAFISKVNQDMDTIEELHTKHELQVKDMYIRTFDLSMALRENARLEEVERKIAERKAQEEARKKAEEEKKTGEDIGSPNVSVDQQLSRQDEADPIREEHVKEEPKMFTIDFRVTATREKIGLLKEFLNKNRIVYGPVPQK